MTREEQVRKEAVGWYARLCSGSAGAAERQAWQRWHDRHPDHQRAWQRIEAMRLALRQVPAHIASPALRASGKRRQMLRAGVTLASAGALGCLAWRAAPQQALVRPLLADYRTGTGQQRRIELADGTLLTLDTGSAADVHLDAARSLVRLWRGEILLESAHRRSLQRGGAPQLMVDTADGRIVALGTRFTVRQAAAHTTVAVLDGAVRLEPREAPGNSATVGAGQQTRFTSVAADAPGAAGPGAGMWSTGSLLVDNRRLGEVVAELARYRHGRLECDAAVAGLRISGVFPLADTDRALALLAQSFPLRVRSLTRYWVSVGAR